MAEIRRNPPAEPSAEPAVQPALAPDAVAISVSSGLLQTQHFLDGVDGRLSVYTYVVMKMVVNLLELVSCNN